MRKLLLVGDEDELYEIQNPSFENSISNEELKTIYWDMFADREFQYILNEMECDGSIEHEGEIDQELEADLDYTYSYLQALLSDRIGKVEFQTFNDWCKQQFNAKLG